MLEIGSKAPEFCLLNQDGEETALSDFRLSLIHISEPTRH